MSNIVYFNFSRNTTKFEKEGNEDLIKDALILASGVHTDQAKITHEYSQDRVMQTVLNTNKLIDEGVPIPFKKDHKPEVEANIGELLSQPIECRPITEKDVAPEHKHLVGELGAFAKIKVKELQEKVKSGTIKHLSPGLDVINNLIVEVSAVSQPAIPGMALFSTHRLRTYEERVDAMGENKQLIEKLRSYFDIFTDALVDYRSLDQQVMSFGDRDALIVQAIHDYTEHLASELDVDLNRSQMNNAHEFNGGIYNENAYGQNVLNPQVQGNFSASRSNSVVTPIKRKKSRNKAN